MVGKEPAASKAAGGVPESVLKKRKRDEDWATKKAAAVTEAKKKSKDKRKDIFKRAENYVKEYRDQVRLVTRLEGRRPDNRRSLILYLFAYFYLITASMPVVRGCYHSQTPWTCSLSAQTFTFTVVVQQVASKLYCFKYRLSLTS